MSIPSQLSNLKEWSPKVAGSKKVSQIRVYPSSAVGSWDTSTRLIQYFLPPQRVAVFDRSGIADVATVAALADGSRFQLNPTVQNRWQSVRLQIGGVEVVNLSNLNNGYSRAVRDACSSVEKFYGNSRLCRDDGSVGQLGEPSPSGAFGGLTTMLDNAAFAAASVSSILNENQFIPRYYTTGTASSMACTSNTPGDIFLSKLGLVAGGATAIQCYTDFSDFYGTALAVPVGLPTGNGSVLEFVQDSVNKTFATVALANAGTYAQLNTATNGTAYAAAPAVAISDHFLKLTVLANDGVENAEDEYYRSNDGVEINIPYCDQINQGIAAGTTYSTNVVLPVAGRSVRAVCAALVLPGVNCRDTQCNGSNGRTTNMLSARATINGVPDTNDILFLNNSTLSSWNIANSLKGSPLGDSVAYMCHPVYVSNLSGMTISDLHKPNNVLTECGKYFDSPLVYQLEGTQDAVARSCQFYLLSSKKAKVSRQGIMM